MKLVRVIDRSGGGETLACPLLGRDVELDRCLACPHLRRFELASRTPSITCELPGTLPVLP